MFTAPNTVVQPIIPVQSTNVFEPAMDGSNPDAAADLAVPDIDDNELPVKFGRTPGRVDRNKIDYTTAAGIELYKLGSQSLYPVGEALFDVTEERLDEFLGLLNVRAYIMGWHSTLEMRIPMTR